MVHVEGAAKPSMQEVFGPGGFLEKCMKGGFDRAVVSSDYEYRGGQLEMAELVHDAFETHHHAIVEAGTGTGKTLAYLVPAICSGRRVVISTATKSLQEQLFQKDIPFLQKHFAPELKVAVMKGRSNFLCISKLNQMQDQALLKGIEEIDALRQIKDWAKLTETGDRAELTFLPDDSQLWARLDARRRRMSQRWRYLYRLHHARVPGHVHAVHGRAFGSALLDCRTHPVRQAHPSAAGDYK